MRCPHPSARTACVLVGIAIGGAAQLPAAQGHTLTAPASATVGAEVEVAWQGAADARDFITIVPARAPEREYDAYVYGVPPEGWPYSLIVSG